MPVFPGCQTEKTASWLAVTTAITACRLRGIVQDFLPHPNIVPDGQRYCTSAFGNRTRTLAESNCASRCHSVQLCLRASTENWREWPDSNRRSAGWWCRCAINCPALPSSLPLFLLSYIPIWRGKPIPPLAPVYPGCRRYAQSASWVVDGGLHRLAIRPRAAANGARAWSEGQELNLLTPGLQPGS